MTETDVKLKIATNALVEIRDIDDDEIIMTIIHDALQRIEGANMSTGTPYPHPDTGGTANIKYVEQGSATAEKSEGVDWEHAEACANNPEMSVVYRLPIQMALANKAEIKNAWEWGGGIQQELDDKDDDIADLKKLYADLESDVSSALAVAKEETDANKAQLSDCSLADAAYHVCSVEIQ